MLHPSLGRAERGGAPSPEPHHASDLTAAYVWSKDLATFNAHAATDCGATTVTFTAQPNTPVADTNTVAATVTGTATDKLFVKVQMTGI